MTRANKNAALVIGGAPRVDLLPPEVRADRRAGVAVRRVWMGVIGVAVVVAVGVGAASLHAMQASDALMTAQGETQSLLLEQGKYGEVRNTQNEVDLITAAQAVGGASEIAWPDFLGKIQATLPAGVGVVTISIDQMTPLLDYQQPTAPLQGARVATVTFHGREPDLAVGPRLARWSDDVARLCGRRSRLRVAGRRHLQSRRDDAHQRAGVLEPLQPHEGQMSHGTQSHHHDRGRLDGCRRAGPWVPARHPASADRSRDVGVPAGERRPAERLVAGDPCQDEGRQREPRAAEDGVGIEVVVRPERCGTARSDP